jgi:hypothetical protein
LSSFSRRTLLCVINYDVRLEVVWQC